MPNFPKQAVDITFANGLDTKTDPWQVPLGNFLKLDNMVFTKGSRLTKRNGYEELPDLPLDASYLTTFNNNLTAIGSTLQAYSQGTRSWEDKGSLQPVELSTLSLIRSNTNQSQLDSVVSSNGLICTVYTDQVPTSLSTSRYLYVIADSTTGQNIVEPTVIPVSSGTVTGSPRVFFLGSYFIVMFTNNIGGTFHLQYIAISTNDTSIVTANADIASSYIPATTLSWDGVVVGQHLYVAYNSTTGGQNIKITYLTSTLVVASPATFSTAGHVKATIMSVTADTSNPANPVIWAAYYDLSGTVGYALAVNLSLFTVLAPTQIIASGTILNLTSVAKNGVLTVYYEVANNYTYDSSIPTHFIKTNTLTQAGVLGTASILVRSVGLASKAFASNGSYYFLSIYYSSFQPTYFLINSLGEVVARFAYSNGGSYYTLGLPSVTVSGSNASIGYLFKDFLESTNSSQSVSITKSNIYSQTGLNLATFVIGTSSVVPSEIANALHLSGGFLWEYDGYIPVEHNFFLWPDNVEGTPANSAGSMIPQEYQYQAVYTWSDNQGNIHRSAPSIPIIVDMSSSNPAFTQPTPLTPTATLVAGSKDIVVSSATGLAIGQVVTDTTNPSYIPANTYITKIVGTTVTLSSAVTTNSGPDTLSISSICMVTLNIPTLRLTYKTANPVKIELFRWSTAQEEFFQVTQIQTPLINDVTVDYVTFVDTYADNQISGNSLIYTTGGIVENIGAPSFSATTLFDDRLWGIDSEDGNLLWYSKQVIEATPVEMSDLFTIYVAPSIASQGSTGVMRCISPMDDKQIIFKANALYYINGTGPDNAGLNSQYSEPIFITSVVGSTNQRSIVFQPQGLMFESDKGIWLLDRNLGVSYIGAPVEEYTLNATVQSAVSIPETTQVRFTLDSGITLVYDYYYKQWATFSGVPAISSTLYQNLHTFLNSEGMVFQETPGKYLDGSNPVLMSFDTSWIALAGLQGYQRAYFFYLLGQYVSPHFLQINVAYNYNPSPVQSKTLTPDNFSPYFGGNGSDSESPFGQQSPYGGPSSLENWRGFFDKQRCQSFQLQVSEIYDPSFGIPAGAGLYLTGLKLIVAVARSYKSFGSAHTISQQSGGGQNQ